MKQKAETVKQDDEFNNKTGLGIGRSERTGLEMKNKFK